jgi:hypothetical protein
MYSTFHRFATVIGNIEIGNIEIGNIVLDNLALCDAAVAADKRKSAYEQ